MPKCSYDYSFKFSPDEAGPSVHINVAAFSFMQAYRWALRELKKRKGATAPRKYKLEYMDRSYHG